MIRAVIFDFGGVIHTFDNRIFLRSILRRTPLDAEEVRSRILDSDLPREFESGRIPPRDFYRAVAERCELAISEAEFVEAFVRIFTPIDTTIGLIRRLKRAYRLALLSNTNEWHFLHHIRSVDVFPLFDAVTLSYEVKAMKPGEAIYRDSLARLGLPPQECVFIDDLEENVEGARKLGIHGIRYDGHEGLLASLRALGVEA